MLRQVLAPFLMFSGLTACFQVGVTSVGTQSRLGSHKTYQVKAAVTETGGVSAAINASSSGNQMMKATEGSSIQGSAVTFPPGSLAISTSVTIEESVPIANATIASELGLATSITQSGTAVAVISAKATDAKAPFVLSIPLPVQTGLALDDPWANLVVIYRVNVASENKVVSGLIPRSAIVIKDGIAQIETLYFGSFQAAVTTVAVTDKVQADTKAVILTKNESVKLPPLAVTARAPFVAKTDGTIELNGMNFRPSMVVAMGGSKVGNLKVMSDSKASFIAPRAVAFGLADVAVEQDGVSQTVSIFYAANKSDFPIAMKPETEICAGEKYYDASGTLRTGTRLCNGKALCSAEGQVDCLASTDFPTVAKASLASRVLLGQTVAGVAGFASDRPLNCATDGAGACVVDGTNFKAAQMGFTAADIRASVTIAGVAGVAGSPAACTLDGQTNCLAVTNFPAVDKLTKLSATNAAKIRSDLSIAGVAGTLIDCGMDGAVGCVVLGPSYAAAITSGVAAKVLMGQSVAGVSGTAAIRPVDCTLDGGTNCVAVTAFPAANKANVTEGVIKSGTTIAGVAGAFPSPTFPLPGADATADLTGANITALLQNGAPFEFFDSSGVRQTYSGNPALNPTNIKAGVVLFNVNGTFGPNCAADGQTDCLTTTQFKSANTSAYDVWDLRRGVTVGGKTGKFDLSKNFAKLTQFNRTLGPGSNASTTVADVYDTIDDYAAGTGTPTNVPTGFGSAQANLWVQDSASDLGGGGGTAGNGICDGSEVCILKDQNSGVLWGRSNAIAGSWEDAVNLCSTLSLGGYANGWRLPTQKETMAAAIDTIFGQATPLALSSVSYWTSTSDASQTANAWQTKFSTGQIISVDKTQNAYVICVRP